MTPVAGNASREKILHGSKCERCGNIIFPAMMVCPKCGPAHAKDVKSVELPSVGTVVTWTRLQVAPKGFPSPLLHCVVDLDGVKVLGTVQGSSEIQCGSKVVAAEDIGGRFPFVFRLVT